MAGGLASKVIFFIATLFLAIVVSVAFMNSVDRNNQSLSTQQNLLDIQIRTKMKVESFAYNDDTDQCIVYVRNIGGTKIDPEHISVYINEQRMDSNLDFSAEVTADTNSINPLLFDPSEILLIVINTTIDANSASSLLITDAFGNREFVKMQPTLTSISY